MKTLYLTDLDGTLLDPSGYVTPQSTAILNRLLDAGVQLSFATARSIVSSTHVTAGVRWRLPIITSNGVTIQDPATGAALTRTVFTAAELAPLVETVRRRGFCPAVFSYIEGRERVSWLRGQENDGLRAYLSEPARKTDDRLRPVERFDDLWAGEVFCVVCMGQRQELADAYADWSAGERYQCFLTKQLYSEVWWLEALPRQAAALRLKELLGYDRIVFFGDGANDRSLFQIADEAYATANADPELKALATAVIGSNAGDGVARWLEQHARPGRESV